MVVLVVTIGIAVRMMAAWAFIAAVFSMVWAWTIVSVNIVATAGVTGVDIDFGCECGASYGECHQCCQ